jgi:hypothetical protein
MSENKKFMAEIETEVLEQPKVETGKVASMGKVERIHVNIPSEKKEEVAVAKPKDAKEENEVVEPKETPASFSEDQKKAFLKEMFGEDADLEAIKEKLKPAPIEPTEEEKKKANSEKEIRLLKLFVEKGGTPEQFNEIKSIANADGLEFSRSEAKSELIAAGFTEKEAEGIIKERYFQIELENIEQNFDNETDEEFEARKKALQKKVDYGTKKLASHSAYKQQQAASALKGLEELVESEELQAKEEAAISSNVDELFSKMSRKQTIELGKYNDVQLAPVDHEVSEDSLKQVADILKDPAKRNNYFKNQDGTLNLPKLSEVLLKEAEYNRAIKGALLEGQTRMTHEFEKTFPARTPYELGIGGTPQKNNQKGVVASAGKVERVRPQHN